jgi:hypothetical protein
MFLALDLHSLPSTCGRTNKAGRLQFIGASCVAEKVNSGPKDASCGDLTDLNVANAATQRKGGLTNSMTDLDGKKTSYVSPSITPLSLDKAKHYLTCHANYSEQEATDFLESLRQEQPPKKFRSRGAQNRIEKLPILRRG